MAGRLPGAFVVDADVLIDYAETDPSILALVALHLAPVVVLTPVLAEVSQLDEPGCEHLGLRVVRPSAAQYLQAGRASGRLSFADHLCLIVAQAEGWGCVTNDKALRATCKAQGVPCFRGLQLMIELARERRLALQAAREVAWAIHRANPFFITGEIVERFEQKLRQAEREHDSD